MNWYWDFKDWLFQHIGGFQPWMLEQPPILRYPLQLVIIAALWWVFSRANYYTTFKPRPKWPEWTWKEFKLAFSAHPCDPEYKGMVWMYFLYGIVAWHFYPILLLWFWEIGKWIFT